MTKELTLNVSDRPTTGMGVLSCFHWLIKRTMINTDKVYETIERESLLVPAVTSEVSLRSKYV